MGEQMTSRSAADLRPADLVVRNSEAFFQIDTKGTRRPRQWNTDPHRDPRNKKIHETKKQDQTADEDPLQTNFIIRNERPRRK